jgi:hypothetical protein
MTAITAGEVSMDSVELISISKLGATTFEVKLLIDGREIHNCVMEVQTTADGFITSVRPPDALKDIRCTIRPICGAVLAFLRAGLDSQGKVIEVGRS